MSQLLDSVSTFQYFHNQELPYIGVFCADTQLDPERLEIGNRGGRSINL